MLTITPETLTALEARPLADYCDRLSAWVAKQPELASRASVATPAWCEQVVRVGRGWKITQEDLVARVARLRLLNGDAWVNRDEVKDIVQSGREQELKVYQLECLHWGVTHD